MPLASYVNTGSSLLAIGTECKEVRRKHAATHNGTTVPLWVYLKHDRSRRTEKTFSGIGDGRRDGKNATKQTNILKAKL